jgi:hypothetical protein
MESLCCTEIRNSLVYFAAEDKSSVIGRPAEFSLVDPDGSPSFLEKALRFIEDYGKCFPLLSSISTLSRLALH